ncbi:LicD family protein [Butyrivibrio sp. XPD2006]|uniref:LicD family protein n=1 Tax=Butyrivibrio sp. XPD2006 TaxID=1280668 RepID=UPI0003B76BBB|nr:LicD family protein [Butyrivibrio sp. XPD2006]
MRKSSLDNLSFTNTFFEDEVREGFFVTSMMKRYWAAQLKVLHEIAAICDKYGLKWFADYGTLIGAVRHAGYVPWDDDLDISMLRKDWDKFFEVAVSELPSDYKILTLDNEPEYTEFTGRIVNCSFIDAGEKHMADFYGCPYTVGIDIFPLDNVYDDPKLEEDRKARVKELIQRCSLAKTLREKNKYMREIAQIHTECKDNDSSRVAMMTLFITRNNHVFPRELFEDCIELPFENCRVKATPQFLKMLRIEYKNFMRIVKSGGEHDYPVYSKQEEMLREKIGHNPYRYTFDSNQLLVSVGRYIKRLTETHSDRTMKKVVFLPCKAKHWKTMEPLWRKAMQDENEEVHVLPIFYYDANYKGEIGDKHDERDLFPGYVKTEDCTKYDFEHEHPDRIVIQVPYDGWSTTMTAHEYFYSGNLLNYTDELVYMPCFDVDDPETGGDKASTALGTLIEQPAVISADKVILKSEKIRNIYIDKLIAFSGEQTRRYWEDKLVLMEELKEDFSPVCSQEDEEWHRRVTGEKENKVIIYYISISFLLSGCDKALEKIKESLDVLTERADKVTAIMLPQEKADTELKRIDNELYKRFQDVVSNMRSTCENVIYDADGEAIKHMDKWDAFYGDAGWIAEKCAEKGIPVMLHNQYLI